MRVIFLDIDGVLNSRRFLHENPEEEGSYPSDEWWAAALDPNLVARLNRIIHSTGALVVISSTWRIGKTKKDMQNILDIRGFEGYVVGMTGRHPEGIRGWEIDAWLKEHPEVTKFVILDDDRDMVHLAPKLVHTHIDAGLQPEHAQEAISHLMNGWENVCEAVVATAATELDILYAKAQANAENIAQWEYELWEEAHNASYRALNMANNGEEE